MKQKQTALTTLLKKKKSTTTTTATTTTIRGITILFWWRGWKFVFYTQGEEITILKQLAN